MPKAGSVALVGRPNAGKSTLLNRLLEEKLAIVSDKPQTTRQRIVGILSAPQGQIVLYDTPGIHRPLHRMNRQMMQAATEAMSEADAICLIVDASESWGKGNAFLRDLVGRVAKPRLLALNKIDLVAKERLLPEISRYAEGDVFSEIVPISALSGDGVDRLLETFWKYMPEGPPLFDSELLTIHPERFLVSERIREKVLAATEEELPYTTAVLLERWEDNGADRPLVLHASILVERDSQKGILIGKRGQMIQKIGTAARLDLEEFLGRRVFLALQVRHEPNWRENPAILATLERDSAAATTGGSSSSDSGEPYSEAELAPPDPDDPE